VLFRSRAEVARLAATEVDPLVAKALADAARALDGAPGP